jgi:hypothetical protein
MGVSLMLAKKKDGTPVKIALTDNGAVEGNYFTSFSIQSVIESKVSIELANASGMPAAFRQAEDLKALDDFGIDLATVEMLG